MAHGIGLPRNFAIFLTQNFAVFSKFIVAKRRGEQKSFSHDVKIQFITHRMHLILSTAVGTALVLNAQLKISGHFPKKMLSSKLSTLVTQ